MARTKKSAYQDALLDLAKMDYADLSASLNRLVKASAETMPVERVSVWVFNPQRTEIVCQTLYLKSESLYEKGLKLSAADYPRYFKAIEEHRILPADDAHEDPRTSEFTRNYLKPLGIASMMDVGVRLQGRLIGLVCHEHIGRRRVWSEEEQNFAASIADFTSLAFAAEERQRVTRELEKSLSLLQATLDSTADGILVVDSDGKIVRYNKLFAAMWRIPQAILDTRDDKKALSFVLEQLKSPEDFLAKVRELYNQAEAESYDILQFKDGRILERFSQPQRIGKKCVGRVWSFRDVTSQKQAEAALRQKTDELERSNHELEQFAYVASHDLQEPIHKILALTANLQERAAAIADKQCQEHLDWIRKSAQRMTQMIEDILLMSKITTHGKPFERVGLSDVMREVLLDLELKVKETGAQIEFGRLPTITADRSQMHQLFSNLTANALKFRNEHAPPKIVIRGHALEGGLVQVTFEDNGIGVEEKYLEQIFMPFLRLHGRDEYEGIGMGLAICRKIVDRHGGTISAYSTPGSGTTFVVTLPVNPSADGR